MHKLSSKHLLLMGFSIALVACGSGKKSSQDGASEFDAIANAPRDEVVKPPQEYYDETLRYELSLLENNAAAVRPTLYVNFSGAQVSKGYTYEQSFIVCSKTATIPAAGFTATEEDEIIAKVQAFYKAAGSNLKVTKQKPSVRPYTMMVVGGSMASLGCSESKGVLGIAPLDEGNTNKNDIGFVFTKYYKDVGITAETIAHEAGHSYGLDHVQESKGLMYYANSPNITGFIVGTVSLGRKQDEPAILQRDVGKLDGSETDDEIPQLPDDSADDDSEPIPLPNPTIPDNSSGISIDDLLANLSDLLKGGLGGGGMPVPGLGNLDAIIADLFGGLLGGGSGLPDLGTIGGLAGLDDWITLLGGASGGTLPDFQDLLNLGQIGNIQDIFTSISQCKQALNSSYSMQERAKLATFIKVSHMQAYQRLRGK